MQYHLRRNSADSQTCTNESIAMRSCITVGVTLAVTLGVVLLLACSACSSGNINGTPAPTPTPKPFYSLAGGGSCVRLGYSPQPSHANVQVSHDSYRAHSETMLVEDPLNPLYLVGGSKFFTDPA